MRKIFTSIFMLTLSFLGGNLFAQQDTVVGWTFPATSADSMADFSAGTLNTSRYLSCQYGTYGLSSYHSIPSNYTTDGSQGAPDKCGSTTGWNNGADSTYWMVKFKTTGFDSLKLYSKMKADGTNPGPRDFKVQYKLPGSSSPWIDLTGGTITCASDWTTGAVNGLDIPETCNNLTSYISIRWLLTSNFDYQGGTLLSTGLAKIDDIIITGTPMSGVQLNGYDNFIKVYPNPSNGNFVIDNTNNVKSIKIFNLIGKCVYNVENSFDNKLFLSGFEKGIYFIQLTTKDNNFHSSKIIVE
jgi:hypothetical protein